MSNLLGWITTVLAVSGVVLNNHRMRACFVLWFFSNAISAGLHIQEGMWPLVARDLIFNALAVHGFILWGRKGKP